MDSKVTILSDGTRVHGHKDNKRYVFGITFGKGAGMLMERADALELAAALIQAASNQPYYGDFVAAYYKLFGEAFHVD